MNRKNYLKEKWIPRIKTVLFKTEHFLKSPAVESMVNLLTILVVILAIFMASVPVAYTHFVELLHYVVAGIGLTVLSIKAFLRVMLQKRLRQNGTSILVEQIRKRYATAIKRLDEALIDHAGIRYSFKIVTQETLPELIVIAHNAWDFDEDDNEEKPMTVRTIYFETLMKYNPEIFVLMNRGDRNVGYNSVIPMKTTDHFAGQQCQYTFEEKDIVRNGTSRLVYLQAIYVWECLRDDRTEYAAALQALFHQIARFVKDENTILYAEEFTESGRKLLQKMGFQLLNHRSGSGHPKPMWSLSLNKESLTEEFERREDAVMTIDAIMGLVKQRIATKRTGAVV